MEKSIKIESIDISPVLIVTPWYKPIIGGVAEVADRLHQQFARLGVETHLFICDGNSSRHCCAADKDSHIWRVNIPSSLFYNVNIKSIGSMLLRGMSTVLELSRFLHEHKIRTVILLFPIDYVWPFILLKQCTSIKIIASYHGNDLTSYQKYTVLMRYLMRKTLLAADAITVCARHLALVAQKIVEPRMLDIHLISNCVDSGHFFPQEQDRRPDRPVTLIHVSNFNPKKRTQDIVRAFARASLPSETRLIMVGNGPDYDASRSLAEKLEVVDRIEFAGAQKDVRPYLWRADIFILASEDEGAPLVLLEAMASGLAWISTPWGVAEQLPSGECGLVVPVGSVEKLAAAIERLVGDPAAMQCMGRRGRERAEKDFHIQTYIEKHCELIRMVQGPSREGLSVFN